MAQQQQPEQLPGTGAERGAANLIEKGWTVYDAVEHPLGTVTDVDTARNMLQIDGRPVGHGAYEIPLAFVARSGGNEVHLSKVIGESAPAADGAPQLMDPPASMTSSSTSRGRSRTRSEPSSTPGATAPTPMPASTTPAAASTATGTGSASSRSTSTASGRAGGTTTRPLGQTSDPSPIHSFGQFSPPYAATTPEVGHGTNTPDWGDDDSGGWSGKRIGMAVLAVGGLAAAGYLMRRRMRPKTPYERFMAAASDYLGITSDMAADASKMAASLASKYGPQKYPTWWGSVAATALPLLAYYAWPSSQPTYREQAQASLDSASGSLEGYLGALASALPFLGRDTSMTDRVRQRMPTMPAMPAMPSMDDFEMPSGWWSSGNRWMPSSWNRSSSWSMPGDWAMKPDVALPLGLVAAGALVLYMARRTTSRSRTDARIRDVMTRRPRVIQPDATVADAATLMRRLDVGALPVCDGTRLIGMLTDRDITTRATAEGRDPYLTVVRDVMSPGVAWATEDDPVEEAARIMREHQIRRLPIVDERHSLVGVVSLGDLATEVNDDALSGDTLERISE
jgi:CBS domain-containing protein